MRLLLVEDDRDLADTLQAGLEEMNYDVDVVHDGREAETRARATDYDVLVVDWMLPGQDGPTLVRRLRRQNMAIPVLMLTARAEVTDRIDGLDAGADDYLTKPFVFEELFARLRALTRRSQRSGSAATLEVGNIRLDTRRHLVTVDDAVLDLRPKAHRLLELLMRRAGQAVSRTTIAEHVWNSTVGTSDDVINMTVSDLRQQLRDLDEEAAARVETVRGVGYRLRR